MAPDMLGLGHVDFITIDAVGPPGQRTFYLQAQQGDMLITLLIEKEQAAAISMGVYQMLEQLGGVPANQPIPTDMALREPIRPLFRVVSLGLGHDRERDAMVLVARAQEEGQYGPEVHLWCSRAQMMALADHAAEVVAAGLPRCPLCNEPLEAGVRHNCIRDDGKKWLFRLE